MPSRDRALRELWPHSPTTRDIDNLQDIDMANNRGHKSAEGASTSSECSNDLDLFELMKDIDDLTPEQLARIRKMNAHLE